MSDRTINFGESETEATYQIQDDDGPAGGGNFVVAKDTNANTVLLQYNPTSGAFEYAADVDLGGSDLSGVTSLSADSATVTNDVDAGSVTADSATVTNAVDAGSVTADSATVTNTLDAESVTADSATVTNTLDAESVTADSATVTNAVDAGSVTADSATVTNAVDAATLEATSQFENATYPTLADVPTNLPEGTQVYVEDENAIYVEDGT